MILHKRVGGGGEEGREGVTKTHLRKRRQAASLF